MPELRWGREVPWHHFGPAPGRWAPSGAPATPGGRHARWGSDVIRRFWHTAERMAAEQDWARRVAAKVARKKMQDRRPSHEVVQKARKLVHPSPHPMDMTPAALAAQAKHFNAGGSIDDAPALGLWNYIQSTPARFQVKSTGSGVGISPNYTVIDLATGEVYFVKGTPHGMKAPAEKETMAAEIMRRAGFAMPPTRLGQAGLARHAGEGRIRGGSEVMIQRDWTQAALGGPVRPPGKAGELRLHTVTKRFGWGDGAGSRLGQAVAQGNDPDAVARMVVFDYLIDNQVDRHSSNVMFIDSPGQPGGVDLAILDHGLAFGGWNAVGGDPGQGFKDFFRSYRGRDWGYKDALLAAAGGDHAKLEQMLRRTMDEFGRVDPEELRAAGIAHGIESSRVDKMVAQFKARQIRVTRARAAQEFMEELGIIPPMTPVKRAPAKVARKAAPRKAAVAKGETALEAARQRRNAAARQRRADAAAMQIRANALVAARKAAKKAAPKGLASALAAGQQARWEAQHPAAKFVPFTPLSPTARGQARLAALAAAARAAGPLDSKAIAAALNG